ncbi:MAG: NifU family protein [Acidobacteria bacterium]|nr:NifU family protein [Acidobacteriota bacterium]
MVSRDRVQAVIDRIRPFIQADGGDIELVDVAGNRASVRMMGNCTGCPSAHLTLHLGLETALREDMPELETLVVV